jgi:hypothetical protein
MRVLFRRLRTHWSCNSALVTRLSSCFSIFDWSGRSGTLLGKMSLYAVKITLLHKIDITMIMAIKQIVETINPLCCFLSSSF